MDTPRYIEDIFCGTRNTGTAFSTVQCAFSTVSAFERGNTSGYWKPFTKPTSVSMGAGFGRVLSSTLQSVQSLHVFRQMSWIPALQGIGLGLVNSLTETTQAAFIAADNEIRKGGSATAALGAAFFVSGAFVMHRVHVYKREKQPTAHKAIQTVSIKRQRDPEPYECQSCKRRRIEEISVPSQHDPCLQGTRRPLVESVIPETLIPFTPVPSQQESDESETSSIDTSEDSLSEVEDTDESLPAVEIGDELKNIHDGFVLVAFNDTKNTSK